MNSSHGVTLLKQRNKPHDGSTRRVQRTGTIEDQGLGFLDRVAALKNDDFQIEVDDFGSGHAFVISLQRLQPHTMKIDRQLVLPVTESKMARRLVKSIVDIGHVLYNKVIAEGVETAQHAAIMRDYECRM